jgi:inositol-pentakisphosphate 2-kinase
MIEVKPKWLLQSPSAPKDAVRCRTCAVRLHRRLKDSSYDGAHLPCPLLMTSDRWEDRSLFVSRLFGDEELDEWYVAPLRRWFKGVAPSRPKRLITQVRNMQRQLDQKGPLGSNADDEQFRLAMTLRDCSVFLRVLRRPGGQAKVVAKIADLDKKNSAAKMDWWSRW